METVYTQVLRERTQQHATRLALFKTLEEELGRAVVTFFTSFRYPVSITDDDADMLEGILRSIDLSRGLALIISSPGGDGLAAERIINLCRTYSGTGEYQVIVPGKAKSAATMVCFGAGKIFMGPSSELGPVDPQLISSEDGHRRQFSAHNIVNSYEALFSRAVQERDGNLEPYLQQLANYDERDMEEFRSLIKLADDIAVRSLQTGMMRERSEEEIREFIKVFLTPEHTKSHGRPIFHAEAMKCGLKVERSETQENLWNTVYELYVRTDQLVSTRAAKCIESSTDSFMVYVDAGE